MMPEKRAALVALGKAALRAARYPQHKLNAEPTNAARAAHDRDLLMRTLILALRKGLSHRDPDGRDILRALGVETP